MGNAENIVKRNHAWGAFYPSMSINTLYNLESILPSTLTPAPKELSKGLETGTEGKNSKGDDRNGGGKKAPQKEDLNLQAKGAQAASEKRPTLRHSLTTSSRAKTFLSPSERKYTTAIVLKSKCTSKGRHQTPLQSFSQGLHSNFMQMLLI